MAGLGETFNPDEVEPRDSLEPVPAGTYTVEITESDVVDTKSGNGRAAKFTFRITEGQYEGRQIWASINFRNANETAQRIGQQELAELSAACGHHGPLDDTEVLHGVPLKIRVKIEQDKSGQYGPQNRIQRFMAYDNANGAPRPVDRHATQQRAAQESRSPASRPAATARPAKPWLR